MVRLVWWRECWAVSQMPHRGLVGRSCGGLSSTIDKEPPLTGVIIYNTSSVSVRCACGRWMLNLGLDATPATFTTADGTTVLHALATWDMPDGGSRGAARSTPKWISSLLKHNCDPWLTDRAGLTALEKAAQHGNLVVGNAILHAESPREADTGSTKNKFISGTYCKWSLVQLLTTVVVIA